MLSMDFCQVYLLEVALLPSMAAERPFINSQKFVFAAPAILAAVLLGALLVVWYELPATADAILKGFYWC